MLYVLKDRLILIIYIYVREIVYERIYVMILRKKLEPGLLCTVISEY